MKIDSNEAIKKFDECIKQIEELKKSNQKEGKNKKKELDEKIRALVNTIFEDSNDKLSRYESNSGLVLSTGMSETEVDEALNDAYQSDLDQMKSYVVGFLEELKIISETKEKTGKLDELEGKIKEVNLEKERRQGVAEQKFYGAVIELLDFQRNELKRRNENTQDISEIKSKIMKLEDNVTKKSNSENSVKKERSSDEDKWFNEIINKQTKFSSSDAISCIKDTKVIYSKIKILRKQIDQRNSDLSIIGDQKSRDRKYHEILELEKLLIASLENLASKWSEYS